MITKMKDCSFFWNRIPGRNMKDLLFSKEDIMTITICTAFFSHYGVKVLEELVAKNKLNRNQVKLYLSKEFSSKDAVNILTKTFKFCDLKIYDPENEITFHPKFIIITYRNSKTEFIVGSSNFTQGGLQNNVEMNYVKEADATEETYIRNYCLSIDHKSVEVNEEIISQYREYEHELMQLEKKKEIISQTLLDMFRSKSDPFSQEDYDLDGQYFTYEDFETFFSRNVRRLEVKHRNVVKQKMIKLHKSVFEKIKELNLNLEPHWHPDHLTSLIRPCEFNHGKVEWLGVRYGKSKPEIDKVVEDIEYEYEYLGFQKHACLQFTVGANGFYINLFHAVPNDAIDRNYLHEKIIDKEFCEQLTRELKALEGTRSQWVFTDGENFDFSSSKIEDFIDHYRNNDSEGSYSFHELEFEPDDEDISEANIVNTIVEQFLLLYPIYQLVAKRFI